MPHNLSKEEVMISGVVSKVNARPMQGAKGPYTLYSFALQGQQGWHSLGFDLHGVSEGQSVSFELRKNARGYDEVDPESIKILEGQVVSNGSAAAVAKAPYSPKKVWNTKSGGKKDEYWDNRELRDIETQKRIELQSCRNSALQFVDILVKTDALKFPAKQADRVGHLEDLLAHYTQMFLDQNSKGLSTEDVPAEEPAEEITTKVGEWS